MKLLSIRAQDAHRAGVVAGDEVLDVRAALGVLGDKRAASFAALMDNKLEDALDLYLAGEDLIGSLIGLVQSDKSLAGECRERRALVSLAGIKLGPPVIAPGKILAVGLNYAAHAAEQNIKPPESPLIFSKNVTCLSGPGGAIRLPRISKQCDYEAELAFVIGKQATSVSRETALDYVAGYTIMNDVTARDLQHNERQWARAKGLDTFGPCGPWLVTSEELPDPHNLNIGLKLNGDARQRSNTSDLIFKIPEIIEFVSQDLTLKPGDIISTGTPSGVGVFMNPPVFLRHGDRIEITIEKIGALQNYVE